MQLGGLDAQHNSENRQISEDEDTDTDHDMLEAGRADGESQHGSFGEAMSDTSDNSQITFNAEVKQMAVKLLGREWLVELPGIQYKQTLELFERGGIDETTSLTSMLRNVGTGCSNELVFFHQRFNAFADLCTQGVLYKYDVEVYQHDIMEAQAEMKEAILRDGSLEERETLWAAMIKREVKIQMKWHDQSIMDMGKLKINYTCHEMEQSMLERAAAVASEVARDENEAPRRR